MCFIVDFSMIILLVCVWFCCWSVDTSDCVDIKKQRWGDAHSQLSTIPSDGLLYAAVSFQKHEESLSDATVRFSKNEIHSDYAAVSHRTRLNWLITDHRSSHITNILHLILHYKSLFKIHNLVLNRCLVWSM